MTWTPEQLSNVSACASAWEHDDSSAYDSSTRRRRCRRRRDASAAAARSGLGGPLLAAVVHQVSASPPPPPPRPPAPPLPPHLYEPGDAAAQYGTIGAELAAAAAAEKPRAPLGALVEAVELLMNVDDTGYGDYGFNDPNVRDTPFLDGLRARHEVLGPARRRRCARLRVRR